MVNLEIYYLKKKIGFRWVFYFIGIFLFYFIFVLSKEYYIFFCVVNNVIK